MRKTSLLLVLNMGCGKGHLYCTEQWQWKNHIRNVVLYVLQPSSWLKSRLMDVASIGCHSDSSPLLLYRSGLASHVAPLFSVEQTCLASCLSPQFCLWLAVITLTSSYHPNPQLSPPPPVITLTPSYHPNPQ